jgi:hypothetical protein
LLIATFARSIASQPGYQAKAQRPESKTEKTKDDQETGSVWMKHKLSASQKILEGTTRGDYEMIEKKAKNQVHGDPA